MRQYFYCFLVLAVTLGSLNTAADEKTNGNPIAIIKTTMGDIKLELYADKAPITVSNFIEYAVGGFYDNTIFHRVIKRFMIQGGGFTKEMVKKSTRDPIANESTNGLRNELWTIAMARTNDPDSATAQFYINTVNNFNLDNKPGAPGYTVFGKVIGGEFAVRAIEKAATQNKSQMANVPVEAIVIEKVEIK